MKLCMFWTVPLSIIRTLFTVHSAMVNVILFVDSFRAGLGWNCSSIQVQLESCLQTCMTFTIAECTVNKLLMMDRGTSETCRVSCQNKFVKLVHLVGFIIMKLRFSVGTELFLLFPISRGAIQWALRNFSPGKAVGA